MLSFDVRRIRVRSLSSDSRPGSRVDAQLCLLAFFSVRTARGRPGGALRGAYSWAYCSPALGHARSATPTEYCVCDLCK